MRLWFLSKASKPAPEVVRPVITGADGRGELISSYSPPVYAFAPLPEEPTVKAADTDELIAELMAFETCDVCTLPMNVCLGHYGRGY